jgi:RNA polymerase sigma-70 factor (ECF subfamily)
MSIPESDLIARAQRGDSAAFGDLYARHLDAIYRYVYYRISDHQDAEDLTEVVFLKAWKALPRYRSNGTSFSAWLYRIAHNAVIDRHRTRKVVVPLDLDVRDTVHPSPEAAVEGAQESLRLDAALSQLKPRLREVILNRFVDGLSHAETAHVMGLREGHVRVLQHRALKAMRNLLAEGPEP